MINCRQTTEAIASDQLIDAGWRKRLSVRLHLAMCKHCRRYAKQMKTVGTVVRSLFGQDPPPRQKLEKDILERCLGACQDSKTPEGPSK